MRKTIGSWNSNLRLIFIVAGGALLAFGALLRRADGTFGERLVAAMSVALAPAVFAWPRLFCRRSARPAHEPAMLIHLRRIAAA